MLSAHRIYQRLGFERTPERDWSPVPGSRAADVPTDPVTCAVTGPGPHAAGAEREVASPRARRLLRLDRPRGDRARPPARPRRRRAGQGCPRTAQPGRSPQPPVGAPPPPQRLPPGGHRERHPRRDERRSSSTPPSSTTSTPCASASPRRRSRLGWAEPLFIETTEQRPGHRSGQAGPRGRRRHRVPARRRRHGALRGRGPRRHGDPDGPAARRHRQPAGAQPRPARRQPRGRPARSR